MLQDHPVAGPDGKSQNLLHSETIPLVLGIQTFGMAVFGDTLEIIQARDFLIFEAEAQRRELVC